jgi:hypothetical protein
MERNKYANFGTRGNNGNIIPLLHLLRIFHLVTGKNKQHQSFKCERAGDGSSDTITNR